MQRSCASCSATFTIAAEDITFYEEISPVFNGKKESIPPPTLCPDCRHQRRYAWRNERTLYKRTCDASKGDILSVFSPEKPFTVYSPEEWYGDRWDAKEYGRDFDFNRPFFEQFRELMEAVPQLALSVANNQNSDYVNQAGWLKNCYLIFEADFDENCMYANNLVDSRSSTDILQGAKLELCYECLFCRSSYNLKYSEQCENCSDSWFLKNCIGCRDCFGCVNLRNKRFHVFNQEYAEQDYRKKLDAMRLDSYASLQALREQCRAYALQFPHQYLYGTQNENSTGNYLWNTQNCDGCYEVQESQDCKHIVNSRFMKKVHDTTVFGSQNGAEFSYENHEIGDGVRSIAFSDQIWTGVSNVSYSKLCLQSSHDLFGCMGLRHASYCVFNKQCTKEEYERLVPKIIDHMRATKEWGEFFPIEISPFAYNETVAGEHFPLTEDKVRAKGWLWKDISEDFPAVDRIIDAAQLPDMIADIPDDIVHWAVRCEATGRPFKIIKQELDFHRQQNLPVPHLHPDERHHRRVALRNPRKLWNRECAKCHKPIATSYAPDRPEIVYCEDCYLKEVY